LSTSTTPALKSRDAIYVDGQWQSTEDASDRITVYDSATEEPFLSVAAASEKDVDRAVGAARRAFDETDWPRLSAAERGVYLRGIARGILERADDLTDTWVRQSGILLRNATVGVRMASELYSHYADLAEAFPFEEVRAPAFGQFGVIVKEPVGVVGAIVPWNGPLRLTALKVGTALAVGCTVVLKASPEAPGEAYILAEIAESIGLPPGVLNVVTADRAASEALVRDPRVDKIAFTGSTVTGRKIAGILAERIGRVTLELGGKSPAVVLDDIDIAKAADIIAAQETYNCGQVCSSLTRVLIDKRRARDMVDALSERFAAVRVGDPFADTSDMGPLVSATQLERVNGYISRAIDDGAKLAAGGGRPAGLERGYFVEPTVFADVDNESELGQMEVFGPVLSVIPVDSEAQAFETANKTIYGLNAAVFTDDPDRALAAARRIRSGMVSHNSAQGGWELGFGGMKQSGLGREGTGPEALLPYLESKAIAMDARPSGFDS